jgi:hypothetical protein
LVTQDTKFFKAMGRGIGPALAGNNDSGPGTRAGSGWIFPLRRVSCLSADLIIVG